MEQQVPEFRFEVASAVNQGQRDYQEDAIITDFPIGSDFGFAVLADGMGGHASGDVASKIVVTEVFSELKLQSGDPKSFGKNVPEVLLEAARSANSCVGGHVKSMPETRGMGTTLIAPVFFGGKLFWVSVGDSPLYLFRAGKLKQLNEDHSMAPQIDFMVQAGMMTKDDGEKHPDRNCLTSVLIGSEISRIDCPTEPLELEDRDILIVASDGLQFLDDEQIADALIGHCGETSAEISHLLLSKLSDLNDPDQDNISFCVIKVSEISQIVQTHGAANQPSYLHAVPPVVVRPDSDVAARTRASVTRAIQLFKREPGAKGRAL